MDAFAHHAVPRQPAAPRRSPEARPEPGAAKLIHRWISSVFHDVMVVVARIAGGLLVLAAGALHLWLYFDYFHRVHVIGVLFLLNAAAAAVIGIALLRSSHPLAAAAGVAYAAATLTGFFLSVYVGLFGFRESLTGAYQEAAGAIELAAIVVLLPLALARDRAARSMSAF